MGKLTELDALLSRLRSCEQELHDVAEELRELYSAQWEQEAGEPEIGGTEAEAAETGAGRAAADEPPGERHEPELTLVDVRKLLSEKSRAGHTGEVKALLQKYGAEKLSDLAEEHYAAVMAEAENIA